MLRINCFIDQPLPTNSAARKSSSFGWVGGATFVPKSLGVATNALPNRRCQTRLTITRAVRGFCGAAIARAISSRPLPFVNGLRSSRESTARNRRGTVAPLELGLPRRKICGLYGLALSSKTIARLGAPGCSPSNSSNFRRRERIPSLPFTSITRITSPSESFAGEASE